LREELVANFFKASLVCDLTAHYKQPQRQVDAAWVHPLVQVVYALMQEAV
jgi:hypothetical protein